MTLEPIAGGQSNPTFFVTVGDCRLVLRKRLHRLRGSGRAMARVLAVGTEDAAASLVERTRGAPHHGWRVTGICPPTGTGTEGSLMIDGVPVVGDLDSVAALRRGCAAWRCPTSLLAGRRGAFSSAPGTWRAAAPSSWSTPG